MRVAEVAPVTLLKFHPTRVNQSWNILRCSYSYINTTNSNIELCLFIAEFLIYKFIIPE